MLIVIMITTLLSCFDPPESALEYYRTDGIDTISLGNYQGYLNYGNNINDHRNNFFLRISKDSSVFLQLGASDIGIYDFYQDSTLSTNIRFLKNIDSDLAPEMIIHCWLGGMHCCEELIVVSLGATPTIKDTVETDSTPFGIIKDLDNDSIPEYIWSDTYWDWWKTFRTAFESGSGRYYPPLVWKWDGLKYRIANFQFPDTIIHAYDGYIFNLEADLQIWQIPDSVKGGYNSSDSVPIFPPPELTNVVLAYYYAGDSVKADSIFNAFWPADIPGKETFYSDFKKELTTSPFWSDIKKSNWQK